MQLFLFLFCCRKSGIDSKSLRAFFTPLGQPKVCPNRLGRRLVEGGSRPYGQSELKIKKATSFEAAFSILVADRTGLEPATSGVTGRHSNQLNYRSA